MIVILNKVTMDEVFCKQCTYDSYRVVHSQICNEYYKVKKMSLTEFYLTYETLASSKNQLRKAYWRKRNELKQEMKESLSNLRYHRHNYYLALHQFQELQRILRGLS